MKTKINIAELLKDCPKGMELDCKICNGVKFIEIDRNPNFPIVVRANNGYEFTLTKYGQAINTDDAKCVIFPKGKTTWEGFVPPGKFKDGDVAITYMGDIHLCRTEDSSYCACRMPYERLPKFDSTITTGVKFIRLATEEEKEKLFDAIKANGYYWNAKTKTLEKLPKFKIGDKIRHKSIKLDCILREYSEDILAYRTNIGLSLTHKDLEDWELVPNKFDITALKHFKSEVLVRNDVGELWLPYFFGGLTNNNDYPYRVIGGNIWKCCIPYEGNEHLLNKTDDCSEYYKNW